jgi:hypothetical protein
VTNLFGSLSSDGGALRAGTGERLIKRMLQNYTRLVFINTGKYEVEYYREYSKRLASHYDLRFEEIGGSPTLVAKMMNGPWDEDFIVVPPGQSILYKDFYESSTLKTPWLSMSEEVSSR